MLCLSTLKTNTYFAIEINRYLVFPNLLLPFLNDNFEFFRKTTCMCKNKLMGFIRKRLFRLDACPFTHYELSLDFYKIYILHTKVTKDPFNHLLLPNFFLRGVARTKMKKCSVKGGKVVLSPAPSKGHVFNRKA